MAAMGPIRSNAALLPLRLTSNIWQHGKILKSSKTPFSKKMGHETGG